MNTTTDVDPRRCPLCGGPNECGIAAGAATCWCFATKVPPDVLARVPEAARDVACVCRACAEGRPSDSSDAAQSDDLPENGR